jgi:circadian clock protein KaiB
MSHRKTYILKLYVAGNTPNSMRALKTLRNILETEFRGVYALKVIDVLKNPQLAEEDKILATPTLAKILPPPVRRIIGDLSDRERVLIGLDLLYEELTEEGLDFPGEPGLDSLPAVEEPDADLLADPAVDAPA